MGAGVQGEKRLAQPYRISGKPKGADEVKNPWEEIPLADYESHMKLDSVRQLQTLNEMMGGQFDAYPVSRVMILGIAGGNGLEHIPKEKFERVYGIDVNSSYLKEAARRYVHLDGVLQCICTDLRKDADQLPAADLVVANLLIEYIGCKCFQNVLRQVRPQYVSCIIQINAEGGWVSDSPYLRAFDKLESVHHQMEERALEGAMLEIHYHTIKKLERALPNGKKFVQMDFAHRQDKP